MGNRTVRKRWAKKTPLLEEQTRSLTAMTEMPRGSQSLIGRTSRAVQLRTPEGLISANTAKQAQTCTY